MLVLDLCLVDLVGINQCEIATKRQTDRQIDRRQIVMLLN